MAEDSFLSQEEIDALMNNTNDSPPQAESLTSLEKDALGEIGNISMGSAATALSQILNQKVSITTPRVNITTQIKLFSSFEVPYLVVKVNFSEGLEGLNLLVIKIPDAFIIADLMLGGDGQKEYNEEFELDEISLSAVSEAMNQMIGAASTSLSTIFNRKIQISPPAIIPVKKDEPFEVAELNSGDIVAISFQMKVGDLIDSEIMQVLPLRTAKEEAEFLLGGSETEKEEVSLPEDKDEVKNVEEETKAQEQELFFSPSLKTHEENIKAINLDLILDVPLKIEVVLGRTKKPLGEVLNLSDGSILELDKIADEPVEIFVNGKLIGLGEIVAVEENFGVRVTKIISKEERISNLGDGN